MPSIEIVCIGQTRPADCSSNPRSCSRPIGSLAPSTRFGPVASLLKSCVGCTIQALSCSMRRTACTLANKPLLVDVLTLCRFRAW